MKTITNAEQLEGVQPVAANLSWLYYKDYFSVIRLKQLTFELKNKAICAYQLPAPVMLPVAATSFRLTTCYPGLLIGSGNAHATGREAMMVRNDKGKEVKVESEEYKLGMQFDYTTGLPLIPGSSIKGLLKSVFPNSIADSAHKKKEDREQAEKDRAARRKYIKTILGKDVDVDELGRQIFEGKRLVPQTGTEAVPPLYADQSPYERDAFFDAFPVQASKGLLGSDYITPHKQPMKNPIPIHFLKIMPKVVFQFSFFLQPSVVGNYTVTVEDKKMLFETILKDIGIGAKSNVGYGQLE